MTRLKAVFVLIAAVSSVCFGATLMQKTMSGFGAGKGAEENHPQGVDQNCLALIKEKTNRATYKVAEELYKKAYSLSFDGDWERAKVTSACAAQLLNGTTHWAVEAPALSQLLQLSMP